CAITFINSSLILSLIEFIQNPPIVSKRASEATAKCHLSSVRTKIKKMTFRKKKLLFNWVVVY
ncbi:hypothetical protein, partial [Bacteroides thetaiotaomicron]|uniref:hypothetical protein n=1 Tax=Bacteroides thetaiotaomicron TaxID=818 RepID=UPI0039C1CAD8